MAITLGLILNGGNVVNPDGVGVRDVRVNNGLIAAISDLVAALFGETIDCRGLHIMPEVPDSQVYFRESGFEREKDLEFGSRAAVLGGFAALFEMPKTNPLTTSEAAIFDRVSPATAHMHCNFAFWVSDTRENNAKDVAKLERLPCAAWIKVLMGSSTSGTLVEDDYGCPHPVQYAPPRRLTFGGRALPARTLTHARRKRSVLAPNLAR